MPADCLGEIIQEKCLETLCNGAVILRDKHQQAKVSELMGNVVVICLDQCIGELSGIKDYLRRKRRCDYLIVRQCDSGIQALFVELKKSFSEKNFRYGSDQLRRSTPLLEYLRWMCRVESGAGLEGYEARYVLIVERLPLSKGDTKYGRPMFDQPIRKTSHEGIEVSCYLCPDGRSIPFDRLWQCDARSPGEAAR